MGVQYIHLVREAEFPFAAGSINITLDVFPECGLPPIWRAWPNFRIYSEKDVHHVGTDKIQLEQDSLRSSDFDGLAL